MESAQPEPLDFPHGFLPVVRDWFADALGAPTPVQAAAWPAIKAGGHVLVAAPTGSGKTLAAFLSAIDDLIVEGGRQPLDDSCRVLYVSPLKALSNDIHKNLERPLQGIADKLLEASQGAVDVRAMVRTGDTKPGERERMRRRPPHILVTTPESLYILLGSDSGRDMLATVRTVIVDEIHALAGNKRGAHLALSLARLDALTAAPAQRIGLSATQKPIDGIAGFLTGDAPCTVVDTGHQRKRDLRLIVPDSPLAPVMANEVWAEIYTALEALVREHRTTLIFVNTRRLAERAARHLADRLGEQHVTSHHGSLSREHRLQAEQRLKSGELRALVATASLELGIDIGDVDLVCQLGSPRGIATLLQRVGRSGHAVGAVPKGRVFPTTLDELVECTALMDAVNRDELDCLPGAPMALDVLAQQTVAEVASREWDETELFERVRSAAPYASLTKSDYSAVVRMLAEGYSTRRGRRGAYLHHDAVNGKLRARRGARLVALTNGGVIPDQFDYDVVMLPQGLKVGSLNEDFAFESLPGDIFQLGNQSYRIQKVETGRVLVEDAHGQPPTIPFWFGEAPGRSDELSLAVSRLREELGARLNDGLQVGQQYLGAELKLQPAAAEQLAEYLASGQTALGAMPSQSCIVLERFFDETGDMHLVLHSCFGSRINRAWGLALRKRFCRKFNFELQAAALEDTIVLSLGITHSFPLEEVVRYLNPKTVRDVLIQALLDAPMFPTRWRWNASIALAVRRHLGNRKSPPTFQRNDAEDLMAVVFPDQIACAENLAGPRVVPDHPLVRQTIDDCLHETMDITGLERLLARLDAGEIRVVCAELSAPSPLAAEVLNARPYAFLDDGAAEERRTLAVRQPKLSVDDAAKLRRLDPAAIDRVRTEAWPQWRDADELHDALVIHGFLLPAELGDTTAMQALIDAARATWVQIPDAGTLAVAAERLGELLEWAGDTCVLQPRISPVARQVSDADPLTELIRGRLEALGPVDAGTLGAPLNLSEVAVMPALLALESEGFVVRGRFEGQAEQWCERRLLARIHRYTLDQLRSATRPVSPQRYMRFLHQWHRLADERGQGADALLAALDRLEGYSAPAAVWESELLPARIEAYSAMQLDTLCAAGKVAWARLSARQATGRRATGPVRNTAIAFAPRENLAIWRALAGPPALEELALGANAQLVLECLQQHGASFFSDLCEHSRLLRAQAEEALGELVASGLVGADTFAGLRGLINPSKRKPRSAPRTRRRRPLFSGVQDAGRWSLLGRSLDGPEDEAIEHFLWAVLTRYGVIFRKLLEREAASPPWRKLLYVLWRMEARGEIRGGRFVDGFAGEQFALPEAVTALRKTEAANDQAKAVVLAASDPCNMLGILLPGDRLPAALGNRVLYQSGLPLATLVAGEVHYLVDADLTKRELWLSLLHRRPPRDVAVGRKSGLRQ